MPRMLISDEEAKIILRKREVEDAKLTGWNAALSEVAVRIAGMSIDLQLRADLLRSVVALRRGES